MTNQLDDAIHPCFVVFVGVNNHVVHVPLDAIAVCILLMMALGQIFWHTHNSIQGCFSN